MSKTMNTKKIMAEFCYKCYLDIFKGNKTEDKLVFLKDLDFCEGCSKMKPIVVWYKSGVEIFIFKNTQLLRKNKKHPKK